ncbi:MAG: class I SAM-dependent methyltransferase [Chloroflexi bacterium]|nr:class I SAM-dependent methyltransferase [Chloroflexota bacterium]
MNEMIRQGHFARKQILCPSKLISWSHQRRFQIGLALACPFAGKRLLDYGCGDGTFLAMLMESKERPGFAAGAEIDERLVEESQKRFAGIPGLNFVRLKDLNTAEHAGQYDAVFCMEVLEHIVEIEPLLNDFDRLLAPAGQLIISVPVEIGWPIIVKQTARRMAGWRGLGDYPGTSPYSLAELWASVFAGQRQHIKRPLHRQPDGSAFYDHKGFNWKLLQERIEQRFKLLQTVGSPLTWLPVGWASQVWFRAGR